MIPPVAAGFAAGADFTLLAELLYFRSNFRGRSSVVERHVANVNVEGSTPFARFKTPSQPDGVFLLVFRVILRFSIRHF